MKREEQTSRIGIEKSPRCGSGFLAAIFVALFVLTVCSLAGATTAYSNHSVASPVRSATTPLTGYQSGLVNRPNPVDSSSNLVVTGNVGAGKHFRDTVPYRSTTSMYAPLGSTSLDSFMRYSAVPETSTASTSPYSPFYSPSGTAAVMRPGTGSVFSSRASGVTSGVAQRLDDRTRQIRYPDVSPRVTSPGEAGAATSDDGLGTVPRLRLWPSSQGRGVPTDGLPSGTSEPFLERRTLSRTDSLTHDDYRQQMEALQQRLGEVKTEVVQLEQSLAVRNDPAPPRADGSQRDWTMTTSAPSQESESTVRDLPSSTPNASRRERLLQETARLLTGAKSAPGQPWRYDDITPSESQTDVASETQTNSEQRLQLYDPSRILAQTSRVTPQPIPSRVGLAPPRNAYDSERTGVSSLTPRTVAVPVPSARSYRPGDRNASPAPVAPETTVVQTSVESPIKEADIELASTSLQEFARHMQLAERYFQKGAYRHAAETYALAVAYRPNEPRAHLGQSHALLAAGQYDASAASLAKALELDAQYALRKVDMVDLVGGPDAFIARFNGLDEALQKREAPMLQFLLAYICYQMDRPVEARAAIETAQGILSTSVPIKRLKAAISP
ncbi:MAG: hypothetical protein JSW27_15865 [Phycisphaerales bacterium]|nr:MAG: hypothetical protein JSW27_15865 [Phycisphaerales bacterium]